MNRKELYITLLLGIGISVCQAQESANASGGVASGIGGTVAYSIGQVAYTYESGSNGDISHGVQQPYEIYAVGLEEESNNISLAVFPNPSSDYLTLKFDDYSNELMDYQIFDLNGKLIKNERINMDQTQIDLTSFVNGTYFIEIIKESKKIQAFKIIKN